MSSRLAIALGLGVVGGAFMLLRRSSSSSVGGLGEREGVMGSPFVVRCETDPAVYEKILKIFRKSGEREDMALSVATDCTWGCIDDRQVKVARFRDRENPENFALLARSAKGDGGWQMNWFDEKGPWGDVPKPTQCAAVAILSSGNRNYGRIQIIDGEPMSNWYLEEWA